MASIARDTACMHRIFGRMPRSGFAAKTKKGDDDDDDDEISRRRLDGFAIRLSARSSVSTPAHYRIRAFLASILAPSLFLLFIPNVPIFRLDSADSLHLLLSLSLPLSFSIASEYISLAASSSDRIEESSETAAISAEIESQNGENDCECFPPC